MLNKKHQNLRLMQDHYSNLNILGHHYLVLLKIAKKEFTNG